MLETFPRGGEGFRAERTGSSIVMETPVFCWLMERRMKVSLGVTRIKEEEQSTSPIHYYIDDVPVVAALVI